METLRLDALDGHRPSAWLARPPGPARGALVILPEVFGLNRPIAARMDQLAAAGWLCLAPNPFDRAGPGPDGQPVTDLPYSRQGMETGGRLWDHARDDQTLLDVLAAAEWLRVESGGRPLGAVGFSRGGWLLWRAAARAEFALDALVVSYGRRVHRWREERPLCPTLLHLGAEDALLPPAQVADIRAARPEIRIEVHPGGHGFDMPDSRGWNAGSAARAQAQTLDFLAEVMG